MYYGIFRDFLDSEGNCADHNSFDYIFGRITFFVFIVDSSLQSFALSDSIYISILSSISVSSHLAFSVLPDSTLGVLDIMMYSLVVRYTFS